MRTVPRFPSFDDLPGEIPIFPLEGALLLPGGQLPLNIFEPRYLAMIDDALASARMIGMIQPRPGSSAETGTIAPPTVYHIGCAGRLTSFEETDDGRYLIALTGICRFRVTEERPHPNGYRLSVPDWSAFRSDLTETGDVALDRDRLDRVLRTYFEQHGITANWDAIKDTSDDRLITSLSMICPLGATEKQALLEVSSVEERGTMLISLLEMAVLTGDTDDASRH